MVLGWAHLEAQQSSFGPDASEPLKTVHHTCLVILLPSLREAELWNRVPAGAVIKERN